MKKKGLVLLVTALLLWSVFLGVATLTRWQAAEGWNTGALSALLFGIAVLCLGAVKLRWLRRAANAQRRRASALASAIRNGILR